jgi:pilus assembly protein CpaC
VDNNGKINLSDALNILLFRRDINLGVTIKALEAKRLLETLAEPNLLTTNGKPADFVAGGEFPFPMVQGGAVGSVTIQFREFGIKIKFLPKITPRGTIQLAVSPEVSALDYANALTFQGYTIPALNTRKVNTEVELESGQSFVIAGLLDQRMTDQLSKIPGLSSIPMLGKLFQSKGVTKNNSELMVIVTPEIVRPIPADQKLPDLVYPQTFMKRDESVAVRTPGVDKTGPVPVKPGVEAMPLEQLIQQRKEGQPAPPAAIPQYMMVPVPPPGGDAAATSASTSPPKPAGGK